MSQQEQNKPKGYQYFLVDLLFITYASLVYFCSFAAPLSLLWGLRNAPVYVLVLLTIFGFLAVPLTFVGILVLTTGPIGKILPGRFPMSDPEAYRWIVAMRVMMVYMSSPLRGIINDHLIFRYPFYRGMGATLYGDTALAAGVLLIDPWAISLGHHTVVGHEAMICGHQIQDQELLLGRVEVGDDVVIGARAWVWPDVKIGHGAKVAAYSVVARGTVIPPGEVWGGIPARKLRGASEAQPSLEQTLSGLPHAEPSLRGPFP
jgi:acetyltransferase-like isoleucine patch superfamily enzyme